MYCGQIRVNNDPDMVADYLTLAEAIENGSNGDTLYLEGSPTSYTIDTIRKSYTIIGTGYFLDENPKTQAYTYGTTISSSFVYDIGSEGSVITGCRINGSIYIGTDSIFIQRNSVYSVRNTRDIEYAYVTQNYVNNYIYNQSPYIISKSVFANNIVLNFFVA